MTLKCYLRDVLLKVHITSESSHFIIKTGSIQQRIWDLENYESEGE